ncbi:DUF2635 domain-containing protein [Sphingomonas sp. CARO-RG-8B-R24-01]|uniref:DUF2635 domain-containing protein n=1 Tax=Sphingomonas sp. CARO-RG-8B-R24-01 TaxID=2914831 RepID=UPI001F59C0F2|nr:DUF2635 domain-containing protein [Sphingomonas sp. CARO-RG-8B-R24-01]
MLVDPSPDALVRDPTSGRAIEAGTEIDPNDPYWARLMTDGDLVASPERAAARTSARGSASTSSDEGSN